MKNNLIISSEEMIRNAKRLVSSRVGVVKKIYPVINQHFDPKTFFYGTEKIDTSRFFLHKASERGGAAGLTKDSAYLASVGETIERYCCAIYNPEDLVFDSYSNIIKHSLTIPPSDWALFSEKQYCKENFPFKRFDENSKVSWVKGFSLIKKQEEFIPAQMVFLPYSRPKDEIPFYPITSTGLAAGPTLEFAMLTALYEIIERDAFTIMWLTRLKPFKIRIEDFKGTDTYRFFESRFVTNNFKYAFFDTTLDIKMPTAMIILRGKLEIGDVIAVGCGTRGTMEEALGKALLEVSQFPPWIRFRYQKQPTRSCKVDFSDVDDFDKHGEFYVRQKDLINKAFSFLFRSNQYKTYTHQMAKKTSICHQLKKCLKELHKCGFDVVVVDLSTRDIIEAGFKVVRVAVPGSIPLHGHEKFSHLGGKRIYEVPIKLGLKRNINEDSINLYPHPSA